MWIVILSVIALASPPRDQAGLMWDMKAVIVLR